MIVTGRRRAQRGSAGERLRRLQRRVRNMPAAQDALARWIVRFNRKHGTYRWALPPSLLPIRVERAPTRELRCSLCALLARQRRLRRRLRRHRDPLGTSPELGAIGEACAALGVLLARRRALERDDWCLLVGVERPR